jgi:hypothetical protein
MAAKSAAGWAVGLMQVLEVRNRLQGGEAQEARRHGKPYVVRVPRQGQRLAADGAANGGGGRLRPRARRLFGHDSPSAPPLRGTGAI